MITALRARPAPTPKAAPRGGEATVARALDDGRYRLDDGTTAARAFSCVVVPEPGDRVLLHEGKDGLRYILHILRRPAPGTAALDVPGADRVTVSAPELRVQARSRLLLASTGEAELTAGAGRLSLAAERLDITVLGDLIQTARHVVGRCEHWFHEATGLLRLHGRQAIVTAKEDIRVDAERISMG